MTSTLLTVVAAVACFGSFAWGVSFHFRRKGPMPWMMQATTAASLLGVGWFLEGRLSDLRDEEFPGPIFDGVALVAMVASAGLFWWAVRANNSRPLSLAFSSDQPEFVQQNGPYAYVRHPFYLAYLVFWIATAIGSEGLAHWIVPTGMLFLYYGAARREEAKFAASPISDDYNSYRLRTGMLLPILPLSQIGR